MKDKADFVEAFIGAVFLEHGYEYSINIWHKIYDKVENDTKNPSVNMRQSGASDLIKNYYGNLGLTPKNAKSMVQELCQKFGKDVPEYRLISKSGPDHAPIFRIELTVDFSGQSFLSNININKVWIGEGKSKKIAELRAAESLCDRIFLEYIPSNLD